MLKLVLNRLGLGVLTLFAASVLIFIGTEILPGDLASAILQNTATPETLAKMRLDLGLDQPAYVRFFAWLFGALHGDFGKSLANGRDVLDGDRAALRQHDVPGGLCGDRRRAVGDRPWTAGGDLAGRRLRPARERRDADDDLRAGIFPRLYPHQICRGGAGLVSLARQRLLRHALPRSALHRIPADADARSRHCRPYDAHDARFRAVGDGEPLHRDGDPQGSQTSRASSFVTLCRTRSRRSFPSLRSTSLISSSASSWSRPCSSIPASAN